MSKLVPDISPQDLKKLYKNIKPVVRFKRRGPKLEMDPDGKPYYIKNVDLRSTAFTWDPKPTRQAKGLVQLESIITNHNYGYYGFFKPSIAEVLAQIPEGYKDQCCAFETIVDDVFINDSVHTTNTILYQKAGKGADAKNKANVADQEQQYTVDGILNYKDGIVLVERTSKPYGFALPGGHIETGETIEKALIREIKEETNLELDTFEKFKVYDAPGRDPRGPRTSTVFICDAYGELKAGSDAKSARIVNIDDMKKYSRSMAFDHYQILQDYITALPNLSRQISTPKPPSINGEGYMIET